MQKENFIILGNGRCGSTAIASALHRHPKIKCNGEVFKPPHDSVQVYDGMERTFDGNFEARGCKVFFWHFHPKHRMWQWFRDNCVVFHLIRENLLDWHISMRWAQATKQWNVNTEQDVSDKRISVDIEDAVRHITEYKRETIKAREYFCFSNDQYYEVAFEDIQDRLEAVMQAVQSKLSGDLYALQPVTRRMHNNTCELIHGNYSEIYSQVAEHVMPSVEVREYDLLSDELVIM